MKRLIILALLITVAGMSGCSFIMKDYDATQEKKLAAVEEENKDLSLKVRSLERRVPQMDDKIRGLETENKSLKQEVDTLEQRLGGVAVPEAGAMKTETPRYTPPTPDVKEREDENPFTITEEEIEVESDKPDVQAPKSKLTPEAAKIMAMAQGKSVDEGTTMKTVPAPAPVPEPKSEPPAPVKADEAAPKAQLTHDAEMIMAQAKEKLGTATPEQQPAAKPQPEPKPAPKPAAKESKLSPEAQRILAMARGEKVAPKEPTTQKVAKAMTSPSGVKLKVLSGTGNIRSAQKMAKSLKGMGYESEKLDLAPRSNFKKNTVYYSKGFESTATDIKKRLGGSTITKPLSWNSEFDIIVVSVE